MIFYNPGGRVINQDVTGRRGKEAAPTFLGDAQPLTIEDPVKQDVLERFADWVVSPRNPYFAGDRQPPVEFTTWARGVVHPVDDMRATTPASVPGLLDALAKDFVRSGYDIEHTTRVILNSRTYQTRPR